MCQMCVFELTHTHTCYTRRSAWTKSTDHELSTPLHLYDSILTAKRENEYATCFDSSMPSKDEMLANFPFHISTP